MPACVPGCSDVFDKDRFYSEAIAILRALLASTATTDTEETILCDIQGDGTSIPFKQVVTIECDGTRVVTNYQLDGVTEYTVTGTIDACPEHAVQQTVNNTTARTSGPTYNIPADFVHGSIAVLSGEAIIDGATFPAGTALNLPPMSFGGIDRLYPAIAVTGITGEILVHYSTLP